MARIDSVDDIHQSIAMIRRGAEDDLHDGSTESQGKVDQVREEARELMGKWGRRSSVPSSSDLVSLKASTAHARDPADDHSDRKSWRHALRIAAVHALDLIVEGLGKLAGTRKSQMKKNRFTPTGDPASPPVPEPCRLPPAVPFFQLAGAWPDQADST